MVDRLVHAPNSVSGLFDLESVAAAEGLEVVRVDTGRGDGIESLVRAARSGAAYRCSGGLLARAIDAGAPVELVGADADWFVDLPVAVTGRRWSLVEVAGARRALARGPAFVKLAGAKFRALPARRYPGVAELDAALAAVHAPPELQLLVTHAWLPIHSEYRTFTVGRDVTTCSPYLVEDDPWTPLLRTHRASFHDEAAAFVSDVLAALTPDAVPPTAVLDVARLQQGTFVLLEVNHVWSSGLYGCDPHAVLAAVRAAATRGPSRWRWRPDPAATALHR